MTAFGTLDEWDPGPGTVVSWHASLPSYLAAQRATKIDVPASYQQDQHLRAFRDDDGMSRLCIGTWRVPGQCHVPTMTEAINRHVRRHDTYRSWFGFTDDDEIVHWAIEDPADIDFVPAEFGELSSAEIRDHLLATTPGPLQWDCFSFGIVQRDDYFTFYGSVDHLHTDGMSSGIVFLEVQMTYYALMEGGTLPLPDAGSYNEYALREREHTATLTVDSPQIREWEGFADRNGGTLPTFPLPLGGTSPSSAMVVVPLMDEVEADRFEAACQAAGARFSGGVFACAALAEHRLTGGETYCGLTAHNTRITPAEYMTAGWFANLIPITVPVTDAMSFGDVAHAAQLSFDAAKLLANVPFYRAVELGAMAHPDKAAPMLSFIDIRKIPLSVKWDDLKVGIYGESGVSDQVYMWVNRFERETTATLSFPDNPIARESVARYAEALQAAYALAVDAVVV